MESLRKVIDYLWDDERDDFYGRVGTEFRIPENHIFDDLERVARWLDEEEGRL